MSFEEPRSWDGKDGREDVKIDPLLKSRPTNTDIARLANQIHDCLEDHRARTERSFDSVVDKLDELESRLGPKTVAVQTTASQFLRNTLSAATALGSLFFVWKLIIILFPALDAALRSGKL